MYTHYNSYFMTHILVVTNHLHLYCMRPDQLLILFSVHLVWPDEFICSWSHWLNNIIFVLLNKSWKVGFFLKAWSKVVDGPLLVQECEEEFSLFPFDTFFYLLTFLIVELPRAITESGGPKNTLYQQIIQIVYIFPFLSSPLSTSPLLMLCTI